MSDMPKKFKRSGKTSDALVEVAEAISLEVASPVVVEVSKDVEPEPIIPKAVIKEEPVVEEAKEVQKDRPVKVKAIQTMRGKVGLNAYDIKAGETYTFPASLAYWLIDKGRAI